MPETIGEAEFGEMLKKYGQMLYRVAFARTQSRSDAEDVVQETWLRWVRTAPAFESDEHCKAWLLRVCVNCANTLLTSAWRKHTAELDETIAGDAPATEDRTDVLNAVGALPEKYRTVVHLFYYEDLSVQEISAVLGTGESAVKTQLHRARKMLRERLGGEYIDL